MKKNMKRLVTVLIVLLAYAGSTYAHGPMAIPPKWKRTASGIEPTNSSWSVAIGTVNSTEGNEVTIHEAKIENDASEEIVAYSKTVELSDETDGTEDAIFREYLLVGGTLGMLFSTKVYTGAPSGSEAPVYGCRVQADRATWDPTAKGSGGAYWVWWDGNSWEVIDGQAD